MGNPAQLSRFVAPELVSGEGALALVGRTAANLGARTVLLVSDAGVAGAGWTARAEASLVEAGLRAVTFTGVTPNPRCAEVARGAVRYAEEGCNALVAVGGGSVIDCAKGIGILATNGGEVESYEGIDRIPDPIPPLVCVPTTAGSAADVSQFAILLDEGSHTKLALVSKTLVPDVSLLDPATLVTKPEALTVATGVDALCHAVEAICSTGASPLTETFALEAVRLVLAHLPRARANPRDLAAREGTLRGCLLAGLAFSNASLGATHALAHALGGLSDAPHGECNAVLLPHVIRYNGEAAAAPLRRLAGAMGLGLDGCADAAIGDRVAGAVAGFLAGLGAPDHLSGLGIRREALPALAVKALEDPCMATNPRCPAADELEALLEAAL